VQEMLVEKVAHRNGGPEDRLPPLINQNEIVFALQNLGIVLGRSRG
jgi:hypothetical protein